jgi:hypothetical protein
VAPDDDWELHEAIRQSMLEAAMGSGQNEDEQKLLEQAVRESISAADVDAMRLRQEEMELQLALAMSVQLEEDRLKLIVSAPALV